MENCRKWYTKCNLFPLQCVYNGRQLEPPYVLGETRAGSFTGILAPAFSRFAPGPDTPKDRVGGFFSSVVSRPVSQCGHKTDGHTERASRRARNQPVESQCGLNG